MRDKIIEILYEFGISAAAPHIVDEITDRIYELSHEIKPISDMKQCMYCEKTVEYSSGVFTCEECSDKQHPNLPQDWANYIGYLNGLTKDGRIRARSFKEMYGYEPTQSDCPEVDEEKRLNRIVDVIRSAWTPDDIESHNSDSDGKREDGIDEIHRMGEAYSKEFLGDAYKKDGLREIAIELGYVEGFLVAKRLPR